jgi:crossover junction endodeoxyribonuclease RusA
METAKPHPDKHTIKLPFPPSSNTLFKTITTPRGKIIRAPSRAYREWREYARTLIQVTKPPRFAKPVMISLLLVPPDTKARDADNYAKAVLDALSFMSVIPDDNSAHIRELRIIWDNPDDEEPRVMVTIELADMTGIKPPLTGPERAELRAIREAGMRLVTPQYRPSAAIRGLLAKGYIVEQKGLVDGFPQAYTVQE